MSDPIDPQSEKAQLELQKLRHELGELNRSWLMRWLNTHGFKDLISLCLALIGIGGLWLAGLFDTRRERLSTQEERLKIQDAAIQEKQNKLNQLELTYNLVESERMALREIANEQRRQISAGIGLGTDIESFRVKFWQVHVFMGGLPPIVKDNRLVELLRLTQRVRRLEALSIDDLEIGHNELVEIAKLRGLKELNLTNTNVTNGMLAQLGSHSDLDDLRLDWNPITDLSEINRFSVLTRLSLRGTKIDDIGLKTATTLKRTVTELNLDETEITDDSIPELLSWRQVWYLGLSKTKITSAGLVKLSQHPKLQSWSFEPDRLIAEDAATIRLKKPLLLPSLPRAGASK